MLTRLMLASACHFAYGAALVPMGAPVSRRVAGMERMLGSAARRLSAAGLGSGAGSLRATCDRRTRSCRLSFAPLSDGASRRGGSPHMQQAVCEAEKTEEAMATQYVPAEVEQRLHRRSSWQQTPHRRPGSH